VPHPVNCSYIAACLQMSAVILFSHYMNRKSRKTQTLSIGQTSSK